MLERQVPGLERFALGINYWPRSSAMAMWKQFDLGECREDMARIASWGCTHVRFFLLWENFQLRRDTVDREALANLEAFLESAQRWQLHCMPTLFTGHMSGVNWLPPWTLEAAMHPNKFRTIALGRTLTSAAKDFYKQPLLEAQLRLARAVSESVGSHPALAAWDLGNEFSNLRFPESAADAVQWSKQLTEALAQRSKAPVTAGIHGDDFFEDRRIRPSQVCAPLTFCTMHGYAMYAPFARSKNDPEVVPFLGQLAGSFAQKRVLLSEVGFTTHGTRQEDLEAQAAAYAYGVLDRLQRRGSLGAFWWCYADYADELRSQPPFDRAPHELGFGVIRADGSEKPVAETLRRFAAERRVVSVAPAPIADETAYYAGLPESLDAAYAAYLRLYENGEQAASNTSAL